MYLVTDTKKDETTKPSLVIKIVPTSKSFKKEVKAMVKTQAVSTNFSHAKSTSLGSVPKIKAYGHFLYRGLDQVHEAALSEITNGKPEKEHGSVRDASDGSYCGDCTPMSYIILPKYEVNLETLSAD